MKGFLAPWKAAFLTGLAVTLPAAVSIGVVIWLFGLVADFTDSLLVLVPRTWTHAGSGEGPPHLYWSVIALAAAILLVGLIGGLARYYAGKKVIQAVDVALMRVPLFNKIYSTLKQINEAFASNRASTFQQVVLVQFPRPGLYSIGFLTGTPKGELQAKTHASLVSVFVPTPPLTSGFIVLIPEGDVIQLGMSVADGIRFVMSLGSVLPPHPADLLRPATTADSNHGTTPPAGGSRFRVLETASRCRRSAV
jgi:uncharacterized membrane protein